MEPAAGNRIKGRLNTCCTDGKRTRRLVLPMEGGVKLMPSFSQKKGERGEQGEPKKKRIKKRMRNQLRYTRGRETPSRLSKKKNTGYKKRP